MNRAARREAKKPPKRFDRNLYFKHKISLLERIYDSFEPIERFLDDCLSSEGIDVDSDNRPAIYWEDEDIYSDAIESILMMLEFTAQCAIMQNIEFRQIERASIAIKNGLLKKLDKEEAINTKEVHETKEVIVWCKQFIATTPQKIRVRVLDEVTKVLDEAKLNQVTVNANQLRLWIARERPLMSGELLS